MESRIRPDWEEWSFKSYVTIEEAVCLSFDLNPLLDWVNREVPDHNYRRVEEERNPWHILIADIGHIPLNVVGQTIQREWFEAATKLKAGIHKRIRMIQSAYVDDQLRQSLFKPRNGAYILGTYPLVCLKSFCNLAVNRGFNPLPSQFGELAKSVTPIPQFQKTDTQESTNNHTPLAKRGNEWTRAEVQTAYDHYKRRKGNNEPKYAQTTAKEMDVSRQAMSALFKKFNLSQGNSMFNIPSQVYKKR